MSPGLLYWKHGQSNPPYFLVPQPTDPFFLFTSRVFELILVSEQNTVGFYQVGKRVQIAIEVYVDDHNGPQTHGRD